jgi:ATP-dependent Lhr-like helicase
VSPARPDPTPSSGPSTRGIHPLIEGWFASHGWTPFDFQREAWRAHNEGRSGLIHAPTGNGKTLAAMFGPLNDWLHADEGARLLADDDPAPPPLRLLWVTPMRALANDTLDSLLLPIREMGIPWTAEKRTGDTSSTAKARQRKNTPPCSSPPPRA